MDFFEQQQQAKRTSRRLLALFVLSLLCLVVLVNLGVLGVWMFTSGPHPTFTAYYQHYLGTSLPWWVSLATVCLFSAGTVHRFIQLHRSTTALANMVGADEITGTSLSAKEKELTNVVEEMAVASGVPAPRLFVMRAEPSINAFVTGKPGAYSLVVTQGALEQLTRDELQGVMGHEFSHLLNGDVQLNLNLLAMLAGLLAVARVGQVLIRSSTGHRPRLANYSGRGNTASAFLALGALLFVAGYAGLLLGRIIKASVSRQRELLADSSSVQFTRNPAGLAGALIKIRNGGNSLLKNQYAEDVSHMCFAETISLRFARLFATHPDIDTRLRRLGGGWEARARVREQRQLAPQEGALGFNAKAMGYAHSLVASLPATITYQLSHVRGACMVLYAMIMVGSERLIAAPAELNKEEREYLPVLMAQIQAMGRRTRIPLLDLALPVIQTLPAEEHEQFLREIDRLIRADGRVTLFEYLLRQLVHLRLHPMAAPQRQYKALSEVASSLALLFSTLIYQGSNKAQEQQALFARYVAPLLPEGHMLLPRSACGLKPLSDALEEVRGLPSFLKQVVLDVCSDIILADNKIQVEELELLRLVCLLTDSPIPALYVSGQESVT